MVHPRQRREVHDHGSAHHGRDERGRRIRFGTANWRGSSQQVPRAPRKQGGNTAVTIQASSIDGAVSRPSNVSVNARIGIRRNEANGPKYV